MRFYVPSPEVAEAMATTIAHYDACPEPVPSADVMRHIRQEDTGHGRLPV